jgi:hypothetical protein
MAKSKGVSCLSLFILQCQIQFSSNALRVLFILCVLLGRVSATGAQSSPQQHVYASASASPASSVVPAFTKTGQTGALNLIPGSPFNARMTGINAVTGLAISATPAQAVSGPAASIFPSTGYSGGEATVGSSGQTGLFSLINIGDIAVSASVHSKRLIQRLSPLDATLTKNAGVEGKSATAGRIRNTLERVHS